MSAPVVIDLEAIENLRALNPGDNDAFVREIRDMFLEDTPKRIEELDASFAAGDTAKFSRTAHTIKGSSANLGAIALRDVAGAIEQQAKTRGPAGLEAEVANLKLEFARAKAELLRVVP
ncbi:MAG: Hpt protein [Verrucomicrobia bacterium]|nr:Hpt protein [Verrucomicrobiota bacterium]